MSRPVRDGDEPPPEAYTTVSDARRFGPLHGLATQLIDDLTSRYDVERTEGLDLDADLAARVYLVLPTVRLRPRNWHAAPLTVGFSGFPGLVVRFGRWHVEAFPACGCDVCAETADGEFARLAERVERLTSGRFAESIDKLPDGDAWLEADFHRGDGLPAAGRRIGIDEASRLLAGEPSAYSWEPWPPLT